MAMKFYNNKLNESLKFKLDGQDVDVLEARLIFITETSNRIVFGQVNENGHCVFNLPKFENFKDGEVGRVQFELVGEGSYHKVWENSFVVESNEQRKKAKNPGVGILATLEEDPTKVNPETDPVTTGPVVENCTDCEEASENLEEVEEELEKLGGKPETIEEKKTVINKIAQDVKSIYDKHYSKASSFKDFINRK